MTAYTFKCACGARWENQLDQSLCPACHEPARWSGLVHRDHAPQEGNRSFLGIQMGVESPVEYQKWFAQPETQAKLKSGEYEIPSKSSDIAHQRESGRMR